MVKLMNGNRPEERRDHSSFDALQRWVSDLYGENRPADVVDSLLTERRQEADRES